MDDRNEKNEKNTPDAAKETASEHENEAEKSVCLEKKKRKPGKVQLLQEELDALNERLLRVTAEYHNYRKRTEKEMLSRVAHGTALTVERLLSVLDTLEMAAAAKSADAEYKKGVEMTLTMFTTALAALGVVEIEALGSEFDPNIHNCVAGEESDEYDSGRVCAVMQKGYRIGDRVIRPAMVAVSS